MQHPASDPHGTASPAPAHLEAERLAALADEPSTAAEAAHLAACVACRREREAYVALVVLARAEGTSDEAATLHADPYAGGPEPEDSDAAWTALAATLRAEGLADRSTRDAGDHATAHPFAVMRGWARARQGGAAWDRGPWAPRGATRLAAVLALVVSAAAAGRWSATRGPLAVAGGTPAELATAGTGAGAAFASTDEARATLARARRDYAQAAAFLADAEPADGTPGRRDVAPGPDAELLRARLATLDALLPGVRAAARGAPEDPAVNQLYLAAYDARETALRQLGRSLPAGVELTGY